VQRSFAMIQDNLQSQGFLHIGRVSKRTSEKHNEAQKYNSTHDPLTYHLVIAANQALTSEEIKMGDGMAEVGADYQSYRSTSGDMVLE
jgi:hypothetical protein